MTVLDSLRNWKDRHAADTAIDWRVARRQGWKADLHESDVIAARCAEELEVRTAAEAGLPVTSVDQGTLARLRNDDASHRVAKISPDLFIDRRPRGDRLVYILLRQLTELHEASGVAGRDWYDRNRDRLTVDEGSNWITRIRAKIAAAKDAPPTAPVQSPRSDAWAEWRKIAKELFETSGHHTGIRFAVPTEDGAINNLAFWWITRGRGDREGMFFLRQVIGGQGPVRVRMTPEAMIAVARKALVNPAEAMATYGREIGSCGRCGRELTNEISRAAGIGPECRKH